MVLEIDGSTLVILPIYNEENTLADVIATIRRYYTGDILAVDDGSTDSTSSVLGRQDINAVIRHERNIGYGEALITGFNYAIKEKYTYLLTVDADGQHDVSYIPKFFEEIKEFDIISGTRYHLKSSIPTPLQENSNSKLINNKIVEFINQKLKMNITDAFCGFKSYRVDKLSKLHLDVKDYAFPLQVWVQAVINKLKIKEIPVPLIVTNLRRNYDEILGSVDDTIEYYKRVILTELEKSSKKSGGA